MAAYARWSRWRTWWKTWSARCGTGCTVTDVLTEHEWTARAATHRARVETFTGPHGRRAPRGEAHPVWDFLFSYYSLRPRQLRVWHPGYGTALAGTAAAEYLERAGYTASPDGVTVSA